MAEYTITIDGYKSGLTRKTVEQTMREQFGGPDVDISVSRNEDISMVSVEQAGNYTNIYSRGVMVASMSEKYDECLVYENGTEEPIGMYDLGELRTAHIRSNK